MPLLRIIISLALSTLITLLILVLSGCKKEFSCENCLPVVPIIPNSPPDTILRDSMIYNDTTRIDSLFNIPNCETCDSTKPLELNTWSFRVNNSFICGVVTHSSFNSDKSSFDFWGHFQCSEDTIFRLVSFYYPTTFTTNRSNVATTFQSFIIQDRVNYINPWNGYLLWTDVSTTPIKTLAVIVDTFDHTTKVMVGRFNGYAYTKGLQKAYVVGRFRLVVK